MSRTFRQRSSHNMRSQTVSSATGALPIVGAPLGALVSLMKRTLWIMGLVAMVAGCKPDEKATATEGYTPTGYTNGVVGKPAQRINESNNIYTRGSENKSAGQDNPPSSMKTSKPENPNGSSKTTP